MSCCARWGGSLTSPVALYLPSIWWIGAGSAPNGDRGFVIAVAAGLAVALALFALLAGDRPRTQSG